MAELNAFDPRALHPAAADALDRTGLEVLSLFEPCASRRAASEPFATRRERPEIRVSSTDRVSELVDHALRTVGWLIRTRDGDRCLDGDRHAVLRARLEPLRRKPPFDTGLSERFLERAVVGWCAGMMQGEITTGLTGHLLAEAASCIADHVHLAPLDHVEIERDFDLGTVRVVTLRPDLFEATALHARAARPDEPTAGRSADRLAEQFVHAAAVEVRVSGERRFARDRALAIAEDVAGVLRFLSPAPVAISVPSPVQLHGMAPLPRSTLLEVGDGRVVRTEHEIRHVGLATWRLSAIDIERIEGGSLSNLVRFFDGGVDTPYVAHVRGPFFAYCRAIGRFDVGGRLVDTVSALEALLLGGSDGSLQQVVGERLAFLTATNAGERTAVVDDYRRAYALRSAAVHHLRGVNDEFAADRLLRHAYIAFIKIIQGISVFGDAKELFAGIDRIKFSGSG